jgi:hypothetical protein
MWKKVIVSLFIGASLFTIQNEVHGEVVTNKSKIEQKIDKTKYQLINPEKSSYSTEDKVVLISGKAPSGTSVSIEVYGTTDITKKNFNLDKLPSDKDYIEVFSESIKVGNMGLFQKQLNLVMGINKIIINYGVEEVPKEELIIYVYDKAPSLKEIIAVIK